MTISLGGDHAGFEYKTALIKVLKKMGHQTLNFGTNTAASVDYPDYIHPLSRSIIDKKADLGIIICGSGNGVAMTANKHQQIRAALCWKVDLASLARQHNNANVIAIPARFVSLTMAKEMVKAFVNTDFEGGRHERRVNKIACS